MAEAGDYRARLEGWELGKTKNGHHKIEFFFKRSGQTKQDRVFRLISEGTHEWLIKDLEALGFVCESFADLDLGRSQRNAGLIGKEFTIHNRPKYSSYSEALEDNWSIKHQQSGSSSDGEPDIEKLDALLGLKVGSVAAGPSGDTDISF